MADNNVNFNFDLNDFNKGIDDIQKRIQQMSNALKVATDPKVVNNLTSSIQKANTELKAMKDNLAAISTEGNNISSLSSALSGSFNIATTSLDAMVTGSQRLIDNLKQAQGFAAIQFTQKIQPVATQKTNPNVAGGVSFGAGGDFESQQKNIRDMIDALNSSRISQFGNDFQKVMSKMSSDIKSTNSDIMKIKAAMNEFNNSIDNAKTSLFLADAAIDNTAKSIDKLNQAFSNGDIELDDFQKSNDELEKKLKTQRAEYDAISKSINDLESQYGNLNKKLKTANELFSKKVDAVKGMPKEEKEYLKSVSGEYAKLSDEYYKIRLRVLDYNTAITKLEAEKVKDKGLTQEQTESLEKYNKALKESEDQLRRVEALKTTAEVKMGGSKAGAGRYGNELFSMQQVLREIPAFTYSAQTGILALSNNLPILVDDIMKVKNSIDETTGSTKSWGSTLAEFGKNIFSVTGMITIVVGLITIFSDRIMEAIFGTKELTEAQKELNSQLKNVGDSYNDEIAAINKATAVLKSGKTSVDDKILSLRELERITGKDLVSSYDNMTNSIKAATLASKEYIKSIKETIELERGRVKMEFAVNQILDAEAVQRGVKAKKAFDYDKVKANLEKQSTKELSKLLEKELSGPAWINLLQKVGGIKLTTPEQVDQMKYLVESIVKIRKYSDSAQILSKKAVDNVISGVGDALTKIEDLKKASDQKIQEEQATLAKQGKLTDEAAQDITLKNKKLLLSNIRKISKDSSESDKKFIFQEEEKIWIEISNIGKKGAKKIGKEREETYRDYKEKEANIEKELLEDYQNIQKLRLQLVKDSYEKEALLISQKYDELDVKARQRHEEEMKTLKDAFETRVEYQVREAEIEKEFQKKTKGKGENVVAAQREIAAEKRAQLKKDIAADFELYKKNESQVIRSTDFMNRTIYLNHKNLYDELLKLAKKYALDREAFNRTFDKKLLLKNIITNEETLKIEKQQLENLYKELEQIRDKRAFTFFEKPKETSIFVDFQDEAFKFTQEDLPKIKSLLDNLMKTNPADRMVAVYQLAIENLKGKTVDLYNIFKETEDKMEVLIKQMNKDLEGITDPVEKKKIEDKYKDLTKLAGYYAEALKEINANNKPMVKAEDVEKFNSLWARMITLNKMMKDAKDDLEVANQEEGTRNVDVKNYISSLQTQINEVNKELDSIKVEPISIQDIPKEAFKKAVVKFNEELKKDPNATIDIVPNSDIILGKFRDTLDDAKSAMTDGDMSKLNDLLKKAFSISESIQNKLTPEEKKQLQESMDTIYNEAVAVLEQQLDTKKAEIVKKAADKSGFNTEGVPKEFKRSEMWRQDKVNEDIEKAELEHERKVLQIKISTNKATEEEIIAFHKKEMDLIQKQKTRLANAIGDIANAVGGIFQSTLDTISQYIQNANDLANERLALQQAISDNIISGYDREIEKIKLIMDTQQMSDAERINSAQQIRDLERQKFYEETQMKIKALELQKKQIETNKKLALAQAAISGGVALANVVRIATEGAVGTGPAAPFVFAAELAAGIAAVGGAVLSAKQAIESSDAQIATIDAQIAGLNSAYVDAINKSNSAISSTEVGAGPSAPLTTFNADLVNTGQSSANYNVNDTLKGYKIYVTQADIQNANNQVTKISKKITFG